MSDEMTNEVADKPL